MAHRIPTRLAQPAVTIGVDPHKASQTAAAVDEHHHVLAQLRVPATRAGYRYLRHWAACWSRRRWAVENAAGLGRPLAQWLLGDGEQVVDVPASSRRACGSCRRGTGARPIRPTPSVPPWLPAARRRCGRPLWRNRPPRSGCSRIDATTWSPVGHRSSIGCTQCSPSSHLVRCHPTSRQLEPPPCSATSAPRSVPRGLADCSPWTWSARCAALTPP